MTRFGRSYTRPGPPRCCERQERFMIWIKIMIRLLPALSRRRWLGERGLLQVEKPTARNRHTSPEIRNLARQAMLVTTQHGKHYIPTGTGETRAHQGTLLVLSAIAHTFTNTQASQIPTVCLLYPFPLYLGPLPVPTHPFIVIKSIPRATL